jgi:hypothetical protein
LLAGWASNFARVIAASPAAYGLSAAEAEKISEAVDAYLAAAEVTREPATRTAVTLLRKREARAAMEKLLRCYARQISSSVAITREQTVALRLTLPAQPRRSRPAPTTLPAVQVVGVGPLQHLRYIADVSESEGTARPRDVAGVQLFCHLGDAPPADPLEARFVRFSTRKRITVRFKSEQVGQKAHYYARWQNAQGETGPWSQVARMLVAG